MAIATVDDAIAGALPPIEWQKSVATFEDSVRAWHSLAYSPGVPGAMVAPTSGLNGAILNAPRDGLINFADASPDEVRLMRLSVRAPVTGTLLLCDRLWDNSSISSTTTTGQSITSPTWPARDRNAATAGAGVMLGLEVSTASTNGSAVSNSTVTYTNSAGTGSRTATLSASIPNVIPATTAAGTFVPFLLNAGDVGVQSVQTLTLGTSLGTAVVHLVAYRQIASIGVTTANIEAALDLVTGGATKLFDDSQLFLIWIPTATTAMGLTGQIIFTQG